MTTYTNMIPLEALTGQPADLSAVFCFTFWDHLYYKHHESDFPSTSYETLEPFVRFAENQGHDMTFKVLVLDTIKVINCSNICCVDDQVGLNWCANVSDGEDSDIPSFIKSRYDLSDCNKA